jgi:hypothetical protein
MEYNIVGNGRTETLVVLLGGQLRTIPSAHANFQRIKSYVTEGGEDEREVSDLLDVRAFVRTSMTSLSDRVAFDGDTIVFDGEPIDNALSHHIIRLLREGKNVRPVVAFMELLSENESRLSRLHLWTWLNTRDFSLTPDGHIIGYKAVMATDENLSITSGRNLVTVNGEVHTGHVPNPIGAVVSMSRFEVNPHRDHGCSQGLHVGSWDYAFDFARSAGGKVLTVSVNPRDVVAVPRECEFQKMRVCCYTVLDVTYAPYVCALVTGSGAAEPEDDFDSDYWS